MSSKKPIKLLLVILFWVLSGLFAQALCAPVVSFDQIEQIQNQAEAEGVRPELIEKGKAILEQEEGQIKEKEKDVEAKESADPKEEAKTKPLPPSTQGLLGPGGLPSFFKSSPFFRFVQASLKSDQDYPPPYPYGYRFFLNKAVPTPLPVSLVPDDYPLAPGDELQIMLYGKTNALHHLTIQEDGSIIFPKIGPVYISGLTYGEVRTTLKEWIPKKMFGVEAHITLSRLRSVPVTLVGEISRPGLFQVSPMATLTEAISLAGGPLANGSLRKIQILRQGRKAVQFDFYRFLEGECEDPLLLPKDLIRIPLTGHQSAIVGQVKRPGIYEMRDSEKRLKDVIKLAGGIVPQGDKQRLQVERLNDNRYRQVLDIDLTQMPRHLAFPIQDWDIVTVRSLSPGFANVVRLKGQVRNPGVYELIPGMRVSDLIKGPQDFKTDVYLDYALIKRRQAPGWKLQLVPFDLGKAVIARDPESNLKLLPRDEIHVFSRWMVEPRYQVQVLGEVQNPGKIKWVDQMKVKDALLEAGGLTENAYKKT